MMNLLLELIHGVVSLSKTTVGDGAAVPRQGDFLHFVHPKTEASSAFRVELVSWLTLGEGGMLKVVLHLSAVDPALLPSLPIAKDN